MTFRPITFLFTDLENSTPSWEKFPQDMEQASALHDDLLRDVIEQHNGRVVKTTGDGFHAAFDSPADGIAAALNGQLRLASEFWPVALGPLKVRMGLHTGVSLERAGDYYGLEVNLAARIMGLGSGGQILLSEATKKLVERSLPPSCTLLDLGAHRLKGVASIERIFQLDHPQLAANFPPLKSLAAFKHNLPRQTSSFIGRKDGLQEIERLLTGTSLLTLLGTGGTGKTRLMLQAAEEVIEEYPDGVWLVEFAPLANPELIPERVAAALGIQEQPARSMLETLVQYLRHKELLLLLDNVEHLIVKIAEFTDYLLKNCPKLKVLVTGREALLIGGEATLQIPTLSLPEKGELAVEAIANSEAVQLFLARAQAVRPDFAITTDNAPAIAEIIHHLDGIPLALELAAARLRIMSPEQIAERLNDRFRLLTGGSRTALPRQQTLQALIDWSWNLLDEKEHILLRRLSVFTGGWTIEAAQAVTNDSQLDEYEVLDRLEQLVNKSLVTVKHLSRGAVRYNMLETIHQYAHNRMNEAGEGDELRHRHAEYYTAFGEQVTQMLHGSDMLVWIDRLLPETDNAKAAREWALEKRLDLALRMAGASMLITRYWFFRSEGIHWLEQVLSRARAQPDKEKTLEHRQGEAKVVVALGTAIILAGDFEKGRQSLEEGIILARDAGDVEQQVFGLTMLLVSSFLMGDFSSAVDIARESLALSQQQDLDFWHLTALVYLESIYVLQGEHEKADSYSDEAVRLAKKLDNPWLNALTSLQQARLEGQRKNWDLADDYASKAADLFEVTRDDGFALTAMSELGHLKRIRGDWVGAEQVYRKTLLAFLERGHTPAVAHQLECLGIIAIHRNLYLRAARLFGAAQALRSEVQVNRLSLEQIEFDQALEKLVEAMGEVNRDEAMAVGAVMPMDEVITFARSEIS